jgi:hypothetical protein
LLSSIKNTKTRNMCMTGFRIISQNVVLTIRDCFSSSVSLNSICYNNRVRQLKTKSECIKMRAPYSLSNLSYNRPGSL